MFARKAASVLLAGDARAHARDQPRVVVEVAGAVDVVADLVAEDFPREVLETPRGDLPQADHDGVVDEADHREGIVETGVRLLLPGEAPGRVVQLGVAAPEGERAGPGADPAVAQRLEVDGRGAEQTHATPYRRATRYTACEVAIVTASVTPSDAKDVGPGQLRERRGQPAVTDRSRLVDRDSSRARRGGASDAARRTRWNTAP